MRGKWRWQLEVAAQREVAAGRQAMAQQEVELRMRDRQQKKARVKNPPKQYQLYYAVLYVEIC